MARTRGSFSGGTARFTRNQAITAMALAERLATARRLLPVRYGWREELGL